MNEQPTHEMIFEKTHPSGADEWFCPSCGRRMLVSWEPRFKRIVLESGDSEVTHGGFKNGIELGGLTASALAVTSSHEYHENVELEIDENRLAPWETWLDESGFENLWKSDGQ